MGRAHFLTYCDRGLANNAVPLILESDSKIEVTAEKVIRGELLEDTTEKYEVCRGHERATISIVVGDRNSPVGPYDGECWITVEGEPQGFFKCNEPFAKELTAILSANGARQQRRKKSGQ